MRKRFYCESSRALYEDYYTRQSWEEVPVFYGAGTQRGHGLGSILGGVFRRALPFLSGGTKILGQRTMSVASDMIDGKSFQDSSTTRLKEGIKTFATSNSIINQSGSGVRMNRRRQPSSKQSKKIKRGGLQIFLAFTHDQSCKCAKTELDVFSVPPTQTTVEYENCRVSSIQ